MLEYYFLRECNNLTTAKTIYSLFEDKLNEYEYVGLELGEIQVD